MAFKIHTKLNRITAVTQELESLGNGIQKLDDERKRNIRAMAAMQRDYLILEMEFGKLIGQEIDNTALMKSIEEEVSKTAPHTNQCPCPPCHRHRENHVL